jgi:hypothetical protein
VLRLIFPQARRHDVPRKIRTHQAVINFPVDRKLLGVGILESIGLRLLQHEIRRLIELRRGRHAVQTGQCAQVLERRAAVRLVAQRTPLRV